MAVGIGAAYLAAARLALLLALPPGYATAVWPAAGLALAGVLLWGPRVWPGIAVGSFVANAWTALALDGAASFEAAVAVPLAIAAGATLQAVAGAALVRRLAGGEIAAAGARRSPLRLVLAGGPLSCLISATVGVGALVAADLLAPGNAAFSWLTWWVGDSIGVVVFTPLCLVWADRRVAWRRKVSISLPVGITFALVVVLYVAASSWEQRRIDAELDRRCWLVVQAIDGAIDGYEDSLHALRGLFASSEGVTRPEFRQFVEGLALHHRNVQSFSWSERVPAGSRAVYEEAMRLEGRALLIQERDAQGRFVPASQRNEYVPISFIEPLADNAHGLGFDVASDPARHAALARARDRGDVAATGRVALVQHGAPRSGVVLYLPVYWRGASPATVEERRDALWGYVGLALFLPRVIGAALQGQGDRGLAVTVVDEGDATPTTLFDGRTGRPAPSADVARNVDRQLPLDVGGRRWSVRFTAIPGGAAPTRSLQAWTLLVAGLLFAGLLGVFLLEAAERLTTVEALVSQRTAELDRTSAVLRHHNEMLAAVAASAEQLFHAVSWEEAVVGVLGRMGVALRVSRISLFEAVTTGGELAARYRFGWQSPDVEPIDMTGLQDVPFRAAGFTRWLEAFLRGETVHGPLSSFPEGERRQLERQGTRSVAVVPVRVGERFWGFLGFDDCKAERQWLETDLLALHVAADTLGAAIGDKERDRLLQVSERRYRTMVEDSPAFICTHTLEGELLSVNPAAAEAVGLPAAQMVGRNFADMLAPEVRHLVVDFLDGLAERGTLSGTMLVTTARGEKRLWQFYSRVTAEPGKAPYVVGHAVDVTDRRQLEVFLREQAFTDPLTRAGNRALFTDHLQLAVDQAKRHGRLGSLDPTLAVAVLDLDGFKAINDGLGHAAGDAVLCEVAARLRSSVRTVDTVARLGGDEFALVLPEIGSAEAAHRLVEKLMTALRQPFAYEGAPLDVSVSLGVSLFPQDGESLESLTVRADAAMYEAKQAGKNCYRFFGGGVVRARG